MNKVKNIVIIVQCFKSLFLIPLNLLENFKPYIIFELQMLVPNTFVNNSYDTILLNLGKSFLQI